MTPNTDAPDADSPNAVYYASFYVPGAADNYAEYPKLIHLSLRNRTHKIGSNTKKQ